MNTVNNPMFTNADTVDILLCMDTETILADHVSQPSCPPSFANCIFLISQCSAATLSVENKNIVITVPCNRIINLFAISASLQAEHSLILSMESPYSQLVTIYSQDEKSGRQQGNVVVEKQEIRRPLATYYHKISTSEKKSVHCKTEFIIFERDCQQLFKIPYDIIFVVNSSINTL